MERWSFGILKQKYKLIKREKLRVEGRLREILLHYYWACIKRRSFDFYFDLRFLDWERGYQTWQANLGSYTVHACQWCLSSWSEAWKPSAWWKTQYQDCWLRDGWKDALNIFRRWWNVTILITRASEYLRWGGRRSFRSGNHPLHDIVRRPPLLIRRAKGWEL